MMLLTPLLWLVACAPDGIAPASAPATPPGSAASPAVVESPGLAPAGSAASAPLVHHLSFADRAHHLIDVTVEVPAGDSGPVTLAMATWTPGSYLIREYSRHVEGFRAWAADGSALPVTRSAKNRWTVASPGPFSASYRVYAREPSVRTSFVDADLAVLSGAATFLSIDEPGGRPHRVVVDLPGDWAGAWTGLDPTPGGGPTDYTAADFDELIDSPLVLGHAAVRALDVPGAPHRLVVAGDRGPWDVERSAADVAAIVRTQQAFWGDVPYDHYTFLNVVNETRGGLEHLDSTLMMTTRWATSTREAYRSWLGLVSHEFFHTWNVKRLRPAPLGPFDYEAEVVTPSLWAAEGLTSYYDDLLLARAGLITEDEYLELLSKQLQRLHDTPGRQVQTLAEASAQAWIKHYRKDENTVNTAISYYTKGAVVGFLLDAAIRAETDGAASLDHAMRLAYARHSGARGYTPEQLEATLVEVHGGDLQPTLDRALRTTDELDLAPALAWFGLRRADPDAPDAADAPAAPPESAPAEAALDTEDPPAGWLGAETGGPPGRAVVTTVKRGTPAFDAGLQVGDELVAIDGWRVPAQGPGDLLAALPPGQAVTLTVSRRGALRPLPLTLGAAPKETWTLEIDPDASPEAAARRQMWLAPDPR